MQQLQIQDATCQPAQAQDGTLTLSCAGTLHNPGPDTLQVLAVGGAPGRALLDFQTYTLPPGTSAQLPAPPAGGFWTIAYETGTQIRRQAFWSGFWSTAGDLTLWGLAGAGAGSLLALGYIAIKRRRRGY